MPTLQTELQQLCDQAVRTGQELGLQVVAYANGKLVADVCAGPGITTDSLFPIFSTGKGLTATAIHRLVAKGILDLDRPIAAYWPGFAAQGKDGITLRHVLSHTAGMAMMPEQGDAALAADWDAMCAYLAATTPVHRPGERRHYHAITYGWLVGETARRADGRTIQRILADEVFAPIGVDSIFFGVPDDRLARCVTAEKALPVPPDPNAPPPPPPDPVAARAIPPWVCPLEDWINQRVTRQACMPASNGFANARSIARVYAALVGEGVDGVRVLDDAALDRATRWTAADAAIPGNGRWAGGYGLSGPDDRPGESFGHGGYGGSNGFADRRLRLAVGFVKSRMGGPLPGQIFDLIRARVSSPTA